MGLTETATDGSALAWAYMLVLAAGVLYALAALIEGGVGEAADDPASPRAAAQGDGAGAASPGTVYGRTVIVAGSVTAFGAFGVLALVLFGAGGPASMAWAVVGGLVVGMTSRLATRLVFARRPAPGQAQPPGGPPTR